MGISLDEGLKRRTLDVICRLGRSAPYLLPGAVVPRLHRGMARNTGMCGYHLLFVPYFALRSFT
jgi:hypothetical protein